MYTYFILTHQSCTEVPLIPNNCSTILSNKRYAPATRIGNLSNDLKNEIRHISKLPVFKECQEIFSALDCAVIKYPACNPSTNKLIPICRSQCLSIDIHITQCSLSLLNSNFTLLKDILDTVDCDVPGTYYPFSSQYIDTTSTDCVMLNLRKLIIIVKGCFMIIRSYLEGFIEL